MVDEISGYKTEYKERILDLLADKGGEEFRKIKKILWDWQFYQNPDSKDRDIGFVLKSDNEVVGFNGMMPVRIKYNHEEMKGVCGCDVILDRRYRGRGYGEKLVNGVKNFAPIVIAFGMSDPADKLTNRYGYKENQEIDQYFYQNEGENFKEKAKICVQKFRVFMHMMNKPVEEKMSSRIIDAANVPREIDGLWKRVEGGYPKTVIRDFKYIKWKYGEHPLKKYHLIIIEKDSELVAIGVFHKNAIKSRLVDFIGPAKNLGIKYLLISEFKKECAEAKMLECLSTDAEIKTALEYNGFRCLGLKPRFRVYSSIPNDRDMEKDWFVMAGDSDGDLLEMCVESCP